jgi:hypothetical protein
MYETVIARYTNTVVCGPQRTLTVDAKLYKLTSNSAPYFSVTAEERNTRRRGDNQVECCGCMHTEILEHFPQLAPVVALHLSDDNGTPMHAAAKALYWAGFTKWKELNMDALTEHLRVSEAEASAIVERLSAAQSPQDEMETIVEELAPRWAEEARSALLLLTVLPKI